MLTSTSPYIQVQTNKPYVQSGSNSGALRFNTMNQSLEVYDGYSWQNIELNATISADYQLDTSIRWVQDRIKKEAIWREKAKQFPTMADAIKDWELAEERLNVLNILCQEESETTQQST